MIEYPFEKNLRANSARMSPGPRKAEGLQRSSMERTLEFVRAVRFHLGRWVFPVVEPICILMENLRPQVRRHFEQAIKNLERHNLAGGLMNLNMVLSLKPDHFLARVYRGRIYLREKQFRLASEDFVQAGEISAYRFSHYNVRREYLDALHEGARHRKEEMESVNHETLSQEEFESLLEMDDADEMLQEEDVALFEEDLELTGDEREKFQDMGPITGTEADNTDWDKVIKQLTSRFK